MTSRRDYERLVSAGTNNNDVSALANLKRKLQSFENPAYDRLREDSVSEDVSLSSRSNSKIFLDSREDLHRRPIRSSSYQKSGFVCRRRPCSLVLCLLFIVAVICVIAVLVTLMTRNKASGGSKVAQGGTVNGTSSTSSSSGTTVPPTSTWPSTIHSTLGSLQLTNVLACEMVVVEGPHATYVPGYNSSRSPVFRQYEQRLCNSIKQLFSDSEDLKTLYNDRCQVISLRQGSVVVMYVFGLSQKITVPPSEPRGDYKFSVEDVKQLFLKSMLNDKKDTFELPGGFVINTESFDLRQGTEFTTKAPWSAGNTDIANVTGVTIQIPSTISPEKANCTEKQFLCHTGVITLQHRRDYCIEEEEVCDGYKDCLMGEDESSCGTRCSNKGFRCRAEDAVDVILNSRCTWQGEECDGVGDCSDHSDEVNCTCVDTDFRCVDGTDKRNRDYCIPQFYKCDREPDCTDNSDEEGCQYECPSGQFLCKNATIARPPFHGFCIEAHEVCDGHMDCLDQSDEADCDQSCPKDKLRCNTTDIHGLTYCIPREEWCDRVPDCKNSTDEHQCAYSCPEDMFKCEEGILARWPYRGFCIYQHERCNGEKECGDNSDEVGCDNTTVQCKENEFHCHNGTNVFNGDFCIPKDYQCDRYTDCTDGSDERADMCSYSCNIGYYMCHSGTLVGNDVLELRYILGSGGDTSLVTTGRGFCLPGHTRCDGTKDCEDGSDELNCDDLCDHSNNLHLCSNGTSTHTITGHRCIPLGFVCDRDSDCTDGSDEANCNYTCPDGQWACKEKMLARWPYFGYCIWDRERCDGYYDCEDKSDESDCDTVGTTDSECAEGEFTCLNSTNVYFASKCIPKEQWCDRHVQCIDGSDEDSCNYTCAKEEFMCRTNNHGEDFCIPVSGVCNGTTECGDGSDEDKCDEKCHEETQFACSKGHDKFTGSRCLSLHMQCDRVSDCSDGSDEIDCDYQCEGGLFKCLNGTLSEAIEKGDEPRGFCLPEVFVCDTVTHCQDGSDESNDTCVIPCPDNKFRCKTGTSTYSDSPCISQSRRCDRKNHCTDGSDEDDCVFSCGEEEWLCETDVVKQWPQQGFCIKKEKRCDGIHDCVDFSDEKNCNGTNCQHETRGSADSFVCKNGADKVFGDVCIPARFQCDRVQDCTDNSDEDECTNRCEPGMYGCKTGILNKHPYRGFCYYPRDQCDGKRDCVDGSDEDDCDVKCGNTEFKCDSKNGSIHDGKRCIPNKWRCDRDDDCSDGSDELGCTYNCTDDQFQCTNGTIYRWPYYGFCIEKRDVCDGYKDCEDLSDEDPSVCHLSSITCPPDTFRCENETVAGNQDDVCIQRELQCDRQKDCVDGSDEKDCQYTCESSEFMCSTSTVITDTADRGGYCIRRSQRCDGVRQCLDASDEEDCGTNCTDTRKFRCLTGFNKGNYTACLPFSYRCDDKQQCEDGSDEENCPKYVCSSNQFRCTMKPLWYFTTTSHWCIGRDYVCDKFVDCGDFSDENRPECDYTCAEDQFRCGHPNNTLGAICIPMKNICNGENDCRSGIDEHESMCPNTCPPETASVKCHNGEQCISLSQRCDGRKDCSDSSDELLC